MSTYSSGKKKKSGNPLAWIPGYTQAYAPPPRQAQPVVFAPPPPPPAETLPDAAGGDYGQAYYDSMYALQLANMRANINLKLGQVQQEDANDETTYQEALRRMQTQRPRDDSAAKASANKAGLFYSGTLGKNLGDIATSYTQKQADMLNSRQQRANTRQAQLASLNAGFDIDTSTAADDALGRTLNNDISAADSGYLVRDLGSGATPAVPKGVVPAQPRPVRTQSTARRAVSPVKPLMRRKLRGARTLGALAGRGIR